MNIISIILVFFAVCFSFNTAAYPQSNALNNPIAESVAALDKQLKNAKIDIQQYVFSNIEKNMVIETEGPEATLLDREKYKLCITVRWNISPEIIKDVLSKYFIISQNPYHVRETYFHVRNDRGKVNYSDPLLSYLMENTIKLLLTWGNSKTVIDITKSNYRAIPNWYLYFEGEQILCLTDLEKGELSKFENVSGKLVFNAFKPDGVGPVIIWHDIYGREDLGQRDPGSISLGIDSRGGGSRYLVRGKYSMISGEYYGAWASFEEWQIRWNYNRVYQTNTLDDDKSGWYVKRGGRWIRE